MRNLSSNLKWAWQAHFLSHSSVTFENWIYFGDVQRILLPYLKIPHGDRLDKNVKN